MAIQRLDYFYGAQITRFLEQIVRAFSGFQYETGWRNGVAPQLKQVPCRMESRDRMVGHIMRNNSENTLLSVPLITVSHTGFTFRRDRMLNPSHIDTRQATERAIDDNGNYTGAKGNSYTVERMMALPFEMTVQIDLWTSNSLQKYQLMEQILICVAPDIDIQNSENPLDWTAKTLLELDDVTWTSRSVPVGTENEIEVATITMKQIVYLSPPAKITRQKLIEQIVTNVNYVGSGEDVNILGNGSRVAQLITTPGNYSISVSQGIISLIPDNESDPTDWETLLALYGNIEPTVSRLHLRLGDIEGLPDVVGTIQYDDDNPNRLFWQIDPDTLPTNNLNPINGIIDPMKTYPGNGIPFSANGQRYLIINDMGPSNAWGTVTARANDIIQYSSSTNRWTVSFAANGTTAIKHLVNMSSGNQLRWTGKDWVLSIDGEYGPGYWRLDL